MDDSAGILPAPLLAHDEERRRRGHELAAAGIHVGDRRQRRRRAEARARLEAAEAKLVREAGTPEGRRKLDRLIASSLQGAAIEEHRYAEHTGGGQRSSSFRSLAIYGLRALDRVARVRAALIRTDRRPTAATPRPSGGHRPRVAAASRADPDGEPGEPSPPPRRRRGLLGRLARAIRALRGRS